MIFNRPETIIVPYTTCANKYPDVAACPTAGRKKEDWIS
jgi:hypothetical protein